MTSNFRLYSTDTIYWSGVRNFASRFFFFLFVSRKDRTNDLRKHTFANIIWKYQAWFGLVMVCCLFYFIFSYLLALSLRLP